MVKRHESRCGLAGTSAEHGKKKKKNKRETKYNFYNSLVVVRRGIGGVVHAQAVGRNTMISRGGITSSLVPAAFLPHLSHCPVDEVGESNRQCYTAAARVVVGEETDAVRGVGV